MFCRREDMPTIVRPRGDRFCVIERGTGKVKKCYPTKEKAQAYSSVLNMRHAGVPEKKKGK